MIATIIIVSLALVWLSKETDYLRINLMGRYILEIVNEEPEFYNSNDYQEMINNMDAIITEERGYSKYLSDLYEPTYTWRPPANPLRVGADHLYAMAYKRDNLSHFSHHLQRTRESIL